MRPLLYHKLDDDEIKPTFDELMDVIILIDNNWQLEQANILEFNHRIHTEITSKPILAKIASHDLPYYSLLNAAICGLERESHPAIVSLIERNPSALLWRRDDDRQTMNDNRPIQMLASHPQHCVLMPWIATEFP